ncbi:MAG: type II toxin-antitoxin system HicA family toxin [Anaerolineae bacterium]|nr:type II toxin-antitoxin system HicA family toxin [Anaerolineae bacterium]
MSKREKRRRKIRNNPKDTTMEELETLLVQFGFELMRVSGSHHIYRYSNDDLERKITVPLHGHKVKTVYVKQVIELLDELFPEPALDSDEVDDYDQDA